MLSTRHFECCMHIIAILYEQVTNKQQDSLHVKSEIESLLNER